MQSKMSPMNFFSGQMGLFSQSVPEHLTEEFKISLENLLKPQTDCVLFQKNSLDFIRQFGGELLVSQWEAFINATKALSTQKSEQLLLLRLAFQCFENPVHHKELAQLAELASELKNEEGWFLLYPLLTTKLPPRERVLKHYVEALQLLIDLREEDELGKILQEELRHSKKETGQLDSLLKRLKIFNHECLEKKYPEGDLDTLIQNFSTQSALVEFPLDEDEIRVLKEDYLSIKAFLPELRLLPQQVLQEQLKSLGALWKQERNLEAKHRMLAIIIETIRRHYGILPYNTQILTVLAFINTPEHLRGRIGQIRTGEGKSILTAMLAAFIAAQGDYVDIVTSSENLAQRDCEEFSSLFQLFGFTASHISRRDVEEKDFYGQIVFGTHTAFEFSFLRDGLYKKKERRSLSLDDPKKVIDRPYQWCLIDEVDSLLLDAALSAAQIGQTNPRDILWIYKPIFNFVKTKPEKTELTPELIKELRLHLEKHLAQMEGILSQDKYKKQLDKLSDAVLKRWYESALTALYEKELDEEYLIKLRKKFINGKEHEVLDVVIIDVDTGRLREGMQWQNGIHQFLQLKHELEPTAPMRTIASVSQPGYFSLYSKSKWCLTGTIGEPEERQGFEDIYQLDSFAVPSHRPSLRKNLPDQIHISRQEKWEAIYRLLEAHRKKGLPSLVLFKTIKESEAFSEFLRQKSVKHQVLNAMQRETERHILRQAGECGVITIATNTAGRGTDIKLSAQAKERGGLQMIFGFYPTNLRVELQGYGRAGRQGQPGTCRMVLDLEDKFIRKLLQLEGSSDEIQTMARKIHKELGNDGLLEKLRSQRSLNIQKECEKRKDSCEQEKKYFSKLCDYFSKLDQVYQQIEKKDFETLCMEGLSLEDSEASLDLKLKTTRWTDLKQEGMSLQKQAKLGKNIDWAPFIEKFEDTYLNHISNLWAAYYSKFKDPLIEQSEKEKAWAKVESYLDNTVEMAEKALSFLLDVQWREQNEFLSLPTL